MTARRASLLIATFVVSLILEAGCGSPSVSHQMSKLIKHTLWIRPKLAQYVDPFIGTAGGGNTFPGADVPFGMVQWSPDTEPNGLLSPGGYDYKDHVIKGFSLTHLSGAGCFAYGTPSFLPTVVKGQDFDGMVLEPFRFSHRNERASPGYYSVRSTSGVANELTVTARTGISRTTYPGHGTAVMIVRAGASSSGGTGTLHTVGTHGVRGWTDTGKFCNHGLPEINRIYFVATFSKAFDTVQTLGAHGAFRLERRRSGARAALYITFPVNDRSVVTRVGLSFVSTAEAQRNLSAESAHRSFRRTQHDAALEWVHILGRIRASQGPVAVKRAFYTALYHSCLQPNVVDDADGAYRGFDGHVHPDGGHPQYANFSLWDIYRSEVPLLAMLLPTTASNMMQSLVRDGEQMGSLPRWPQANGETGIMFGDPADPTLAGAYAFGARGFDSREALALMRRGGSLPTKEIAGYRERPHLGKYLKLGYVAAPVYGSASMTLEYTTDDAAIADFARGLHDSSVAAAFAGRASAWSHLFDSHVGAIQPRMSNGTVPSAYSASASNAFIEGTDSQYTWTVPQDIGKLIKLLGGVRQARVYLGEFLQRLNAGPDAGAEWIGNEPGFGTPWLFDWLGRPRLTQHFVGEIKNRLFTAKPDGLPGNDDLGALSSWYVWAAMGLYPEVPGKPILAVGAPTFRSLTIYRSRGRKLVVTRFPSRTSRNLGKPLLGGRSVKWRIQWQQLVQAGHLTIPVVSVQRGL